jgi:uncharacterized protein (TIGR00290 family)
MSWSGGKDCLMALEALQREATHRVCALVTSIARANPNSEARVPIHELQMELLERQAASIGLPLRTIEIPPKATNIEYEAAWLAALDGLRAEFNFDECNPPRIAFGDLFLEDVRLFREALLARGCWRGLFPLWGCDTAKLVREFIERGYKAIITSVDCTRLDASFVGEMITNRFLARLPAGVDPCGERGEFHSFVFDGVGFREPVLFKKGGVYSIGMHHVCELVPIEGLLCVAEQRAEPVGESNS